MGSGNESANTPGTGHFILLHESDNILVCSRSAVAGQKVEVDGANHWLSTDIVLGHKIARIPLKKGDKVLRYGIPIGSMSADASAAEHIHSHNMQSDYIPAHGRGAVHEKKDRS